MLQLYGWLLALTADGDSPGISQLCASESETWNIYIISISTHTDM